MHNSEKCAVCSKNLSLVQSIAGKCKCSKIFCLNHHIPEKHSCEYNYKCTYQNKLSSNMPYIQSEKIIKI